MSVFTIPVKGPHFSQRPPAEIFLSLPWLLSIHTMTSWICIVVEINVALGGWCDTYSKQLPLFFFFFFFFFPSVVWSKRGWAGSEWCGYRKPDTSSAVVSLKEHFVMYLHLVKYLQPSSHHRWIKVCFALFDAVWCQLRCETSNRRVKKKKAHISKTGIAFFFVLFLVFIFFLSFFFHFLSTHERFSLFLVSDER